jgi:hypothetical protein
VISQFVPALRQHHHADHVEPLAHGVQRPRHREDEDARQVEDIRDQNHHAR